MREKFREHFLEFCKLQMHEMEVYKYLESEKAGYDLGKSIYTEWIKKYGKAFRRQYIEKNLLVVEENLDKVKNLLPNGEGKELVDSCKDLIQLVEDLFEIGGDEYVNQDGSKITNLESGK
jgi:hypothetical protein